MWREFFTPEILLLLGTLQALSPYILWAIQGLNPYYNYELTYLPIAIWITGYAAFWIGAKMIRINKSLQTQPIINISLADLKKITILLVIVTIVQIILVVRVFGIVPILGYIQGIANVGEINESQQDSGFGQLGILLVSLSTINALLLIWIFKLRESKIKPNFLFYTLIFIEVFGTTLSGKRQGLVASIFFLFCGLSIYYKDSLEVVLNVFGIFKNKILRFLIFWATLFSTVGFIGFLGSVRTGSGNQVSGLDIIIGYLQYPLINLEIQCLDVGLGPYKYNFIYTFLSLLPYKIKEYTELRDFPIRAETTIGAGFYGTLHWGLGIIGIIAFSFLLGLICKYFYKKSFTSLFHLLVYCQISWTLFAAHSYNHFLNLIFIPIPSIVFAIFCLLFNQKTKSVGK